MKLRNIITPVAIGIIATFSSCKKDGNLFCKNGNGDTTIEKSVVSAFSEIDLQTTAKIYLTEAADYTVTVHASSNIHEYIELDVRGNELEIDTKSGKCIDDDNLVMYITAPKYTRLKISGCGSIVNEKALTSDNLEVKISGSGEVNLTDITVQSYNIDVSGSGDVTLEGSPVADGKIKISGSGDVDVLALATKDMEIKVSGSGEANVNVSNSLKVEVSGSGDINYIGNASVSLDTSGSGSVQKL